MSALVTNENGTVNQATKLEFMEQEALHAWTVFLCSLPILAIIYYHIQKRIGEDQAQDWK